MTNRPSSGLPAIPDGPYRDVLLAVQDELEKDRDELEAIHEALAAMGALAGDGPLVQGELVSRLRIVANGLAVSMRRLYLQPGKTPELSDEISAGTLALPSGGGSGGSGGGTTTVTQIQIFPCGVAGISIG